MFTRRLQQSRSFGQSQHLTQASLTREQNRICNRYDFTWKLGNLARDSIFFTKDVEVGRSRFAGIRQSVGESSDMTQTTHPSGDLWMKDAYLSNSGLSPRPHAGTSAKLRRIRPGLPRKASAATLE